MPELPVYEILAQAFVQEEVNTCFALLGDANMNWATSMAQQGCRFIYVRDEHCAVAAAMAHARMTGDVGVASVTCGPGLTQILTALPAAARANIPMVIFAGEAPLKSAWYNQAIEQRPFVEACGACYEQLHSIDRMPLQVRDAFLHARQFQQPVVLGIPLDLQDQFYTPGLKLPPPSKAVWIKPDDALPNPNAISQVASRLAAARRIVIMAGRGAVLADAGPACIELADKLGAVLATTLPARGLFSKHPFSIGIAGGYSTDLAREYLQNSDVILAIGTSLAHHNSDAGKLFPADKIVHLDHHPRSRSQGRDAAKTHLAADARLGVEALIKALDQPTNATNTENQHQEWRTEQLAREIRDRPADAKTFEIEENLLDPRDVVTALDSLLPREWSVVNSSGHCAYFFAQMPQRPVDNFLTIREFGAIGNGISFAIGAALSRPEHPVVLFDGDGSLLMHIQELETILRHKLNILICVLNDGAYGSEIHKLRAEGLDDSGAVFGRRDFARMAHGFELDGAVVTDLDTLPEKLEQFKETGGACIWDFHVSDKVVSPVIRRSHG